MQSCFLFLYASTLWEGTKCIFLIDKTWHIWEAFNDHLFFVHKCHAIIMNLRILTRTPAYFAFGLRLSSGSFNKLFWRVFYHFDIHQ